MSNPRSNTAKRKQPKLVMLPSVGAPDPELAGSVFQLLASLKAAKQQREAGLCNTKTQAVTRNV